MKKKIEIVGVPFDNLNYSEVLDRISTFVDDKRKVYIVTANPEMILNASQDEKFFDVLKNSELTTPDGTGVLWASSYLKKKRPKGFMFYYFQLFQSLLLIPFYPKSIRDVFKERVTGVDLFKKIIEHSQDKKWRIFLLGASKGVAEKVIKRFLSTHPHAHFVGCFAGSPAVDEEETICEQINQVRPDILFVAYGSPDQEFWIRRNLFKLHSVKVGMGVGGSFDFYAEKIKRAPKWMQRIGLEWLWRLSREPNRLLRIWNATFKFIGLVAKEKREKKPPQ